MFSDGTGLPVGGGLLAAALVYAGASFFVTGQLIGERIIERSDWGAQCQAALRAEIAEHAPEPEFTPRFDCNSFLGVFGDEGRQICRQYGNPEFKLPMMDQVQDYQRRLRVANEQRLEAKIDRSGSRCDCASTVVLAEERTGFAILAGSARQITPPAINALDASLMSALRSPRCAS